MSVRVVPWILALAGLAFPLVGTGFAVWPFTVGWLIALVVGWLLGAPMLPTRAHRIAAALVLLPILVALAWEGGWWLIPADIAWLVIEVADREPRRVSQADA